MARHIAWTPEETIERITTEFADALHELDTLETQLRTELDTLEALSA